jgi:hypothetical protein
MFVFIMIVMILVRVQTLDNFTPNQSSLFIIRGDPEYPSLGSSEKSFLVLMSIL